MVLVQVLRQTQIRLLLKSGWELETYDTYISSALKIIKIIKRINSFLYIYIRQF